MLPEAHFLSVTTSKDTSCPSPHLVLTLKSVDCVCVLVGVEGEAASTAVWPHPLSSLHQPGLPGPGH